MSQEANLELKKKKCCKLEKYTSINSLGDVRNEKRKE